MGVFRLSDRFRWYRSDSVEYSLGLTAGSLKDELDSEAHLLIDPEIMGCFHLYPLNDEIFGAIETWRP